MSYPHRRSLFSTVLAGTGLIILGSVLFLLLKPQSKPVDALVTPVEVEFPAPALELTQLGGDAVSLEAELGSILLVNMWATWCPPCKAEMPTLEAFYKKYQQAGFKIIGINDGEAQSIVESFVEKYQLTFPIWLDAEYKSERAFGTINLPSSFVIDRHGIVRLMWIGAIDDKHLEKYVTPLIKE